MTFKKPFKAVLLKPKRLKGIDELHEPLWSPPRKRAPIKWFYAAVALFIGICWGLAYLLST